MDGLRIYISPDKMTVTNERVHLAFDRHFQDEESPTRMLSGTDIPRLFEAINCLNSLSAAPNVAIASRISAENELMQLKEDDNAEMAGNHTRRRRS